MKLLVAKLKSEDMRIAYKIRYLLAIVLLSGCVGIQESNGPAPAVKDLKSKDISYALEKNIPYLEEAFLDTAPDKMNDGIVVGQLGTDSGNKEMVLTFAQEISDNIHNNTDSLLIYNKGKLIFESYYKRGRINYPHYQRSVTKCYTALAIGRAIQLGYMTMADLDKPVVSFLKDIDKSKLVPGATEVTLHEAMYMHSGIRADHAKARKCMRVMKKEGKLKGQWQIQAYMELSEPITKESKATFKYQPADTAITMQVLEAVVPRTAKDFIQNELLEKMGINNYAWQTDVSGLPQSYAHSSFLSRDMVKMGILVLQDGKWNGKQLIPAEFLERATAPLDVNEVRTYGYFWWGHDVKIADKKYKCVSARGSGGQFILIFPELDLILVTTSHNKGMGTILETAPENIIPAFIQ